MYTPEQLPAKSKWSHAVDQGIYNGGGKAEGYVQFLKLEKVKQHLSVIHHLWKIVRKYVRR